MATDLEIWSHAKANGFVVVSKDADFHQMSFLLGAPPKVVWLRMGNCRTDELLSAWLSHAKRLRDFEVDEEASFLVLP